MENPYPSLLSSKEPIVIGSGAIGGKATGLFSVAGTVERLFPEDRFSDMTVGIPPLTVVGTDSFDAFVDLNDLDPSSVSSLNDERIIYKLKKSILPPKILGMLRRIATEIRFPLAVRSSSLLEDSVDHPFAGVYGTKMVPGCDPSPDVRYQHLLDAVKFVYASTFFEAARQYAASAEVSYSSEKMAVIIQMVAGVRRWERFYPSVSGVARSVNFYPTPRTKSGDGVVTLALGLGKSIVDGGTCWSYCPATPKAPSLFNSPADMLKRSQTRFWAINMGKPAEHNPFGEDEHLVSGDLSQAEYDQMLSHVASTYVSASDRFFPGIHREGPRMIDFAPLLMYRELPLNEIVVDLLSACEDKVGAPVEIEFALTDDPQNREPARFSCLQVRPISVNQQVVDLPSENETAHVRVISADRALGNGIRDDISEIVYLHPGALDGRRSFDAATEIARINRRMVQEHRPYLLIVFGRLGTSDPFRGVPGDWSRFAGAKVIVEVMTESIMTDFSQGSHFFQNMTSANVLYFSLNDRSSAIDWEWLAAQEEVDSSKNIRHIRTSAPLEVMVDGRCNTGVILRHGQ